MPLFCLSNLEESHWTQFFHKTKWGETKFVFVLMYVMTKCISWHGQTYRGGRRESKGEGRESERERGIFPTHSSAICFANRSTFVCFERLNEAVNKHGQSTHTYTHTHTHPHTHRHMCSSNKDSSLIRINSCCQINYI